MRESETQIIGKVFQCAVSTIGFSISSMKKLLLAELSKKGLYGTCYHELSRWQKILSLGPFFSSLNEQEKRPNAIKKKKADDDDTLKALTDKLCSKKGDYRWPS